MVWISDLKPSQHARNLDVSLFNSWEEGKISTETTIKWFKKNNRIPDRVFIGKDEFVKWLNSLGYIREEQNDAEICK